MKDVYVPQGQTDRLIHLLEDNQSIFQPERLYDAANTWFNQAGVGTYEMLIAINLSGLKFVPDNVVRPFMNDIFLIACYFYCVGTHMSEILVMSISVFLVEPDRMISQSMKHIHVY